MEHQNITLHETMEIHQLINFETISMNTSKLLLGVVFDKELKESLEKDVQQSIKAVNILLGLLNKTKAHRHLNDANSGKRLL